MAVLLEQVLERTLAILPVTREELLLRGITGQVTERLFELKKATAHLQDVYGSKSNLEEKIRRAGVSPDDHTLYTDLLEWRSIESEMSELFGILGHG